MDIDYNLIGKRIATIRKSKGLTQAQLAESADITNNFLSHIERSHSIPSLETLIKICDALDVTPNQILLGTKTDTPDYLADEISERLASCTPKQRRFILKTLDLLLSEGLT